MRELLNTEMLVAFITFCPKEALELSYMKMAQILMTQSCNRKSSLRNSWDKVQDLES